MEAHLEHDHVEVGEGLADAAEDDEVGPGALAAGRGGEGEVGAVEAAHLRHDAAAHALKNIALISFPFHRLILLGILVMGRPLYTYLYSVHFSLEHKNE